ncbi:MAG: hypothetical protein ACR652_07120 [Methylocystis sp.]|uniref:hypothetical protein n=1 Tax=Methylocystis sp. TaxID=1911079 RepID=UPI003DA449FC
MASLVRLAAALSLALTAGASLALEGKRVANNDSPALTHDRAGQARDDNAMQALCREILVDTDEGYGVTNREARVVCDELR